MSARYRTIGPLGGKVMPAGFEGQIGALRRLPVSSLVVDATYQRQISPSSAKNILRIAASFDWAKFLPVIVVPEGKRFAIVDGQHRATAAATIGIEEVPCYVLQCSAREAAAAFAAINGTVTKIDAVDLYLAELAAGAPHALELQRVMAAADVVVTRKKADYGVGETRSIRVLYRAMEKYGSHLLVTILQCITQTGDGNPGGLCGGIINGVAQAIRTKTGLLANPSRLFDILDEVSLTELREQARQECATTRNVPQFVITREINKLIANAREAA